MKWLLGFIPAVLAGTIPVNPIELGDAPPPGQVSLTPVCSHVYYTYAYNRSLSVVSPMEEPDALRVP